MKCGRGILAVAAVLAAALNGPARAASHSDAPLIKQDPQANLTDVYAFIGPKYNDASVKVLNVIVHVRPLIDPGDGVCYDRFADDALYSIHIANPATGALLQRYDFRFSQVNPTGAPGLKNGNTILSYGRGADVNGQPDVGAIQNIGDNHHNYTQTYSLTRIAGSTQTVLG